jgi:hypothetical protein
VARIPLTGWLRLDAGVDFEGNRWTINATAPASGQPREGDQMRFNGAFPTDALTLYTHDTAPFVALNFNLLGGRLTINPQLRFEIFSAAGYLGQPRSFSHADFVPEPRLAARYQFTSWMAIKGALGFYHQQPDPGSYSSQFGNVNIQPEKGLHYVLGFEFQPTSTLHIEVQGFYKDLRSLIVRSEQGAKTILDNDGIGRVYGGELLVRQEIWKNFFGWITYTVSRSERRDHPDEPWRVFQYDQTHILNLIASYRFPRGFQLGVRFRYVTGNPYTPVKSAYYDSTNNQFMPNYAQTYSGRLDAFNQLDVRIDKTWTYNKWKLSLYIDIQNVYYAQNEEGVAYNYDFSKPRPVTGLPFLPVLGMRGEF